MGQFPCAPSWLRAWPQLPCYCNESYAVYSPLNAADNWSNPSWNYWRARLLLVQLKYSSCRRARCISQFADWLRVDSPADTLFSTRRSLVGTDEMTRDVCTRTGCTGTGCTRTGTGTSRAAPRRLLINVAATLHWATPASQDVALSRVYTRSCSLIHVSRTSSLYPDTSGYN